MSNENNKTTASLVANQLRSMGNDKKAKEMSRFFKTGYGEYAQHDAFLGISTKETNDVAKQNYKLINLSQTAYLLQSKYHEIRRTGLEILVLKMQKESDEAKRQKIVLCYLNNIDSINNWDLVDNSAPDILGAFLIDKDKTMLYDFAVSENLWKQRIAILSTLYFIRNEQFEDTLAICEILLDNKHDLIHKATGWMLREIGKRNIEVELQFLDKYATIMPRTELRYAVEKFDDTLREYYMSL